MVNGKNKNGTFQTENDAKQWIIETRKERTIAGAKWRAENRSAQDADYLEAKGHQGTIAAVLDRCCEVDWANSELSQKRGLRAARLIGLMRPIMDIDVEDLDNLALYLLKNGYKTRTILLYLSAISVILKRARRMGLITQLPLMPERRTLPVPELKDLIIMAEWYSPFYQSLNSEVHKQLSEFLWESGCRIGEALNLTWERINFTDRTVSFVKTKTCNPRRLPIGDRLEACLLMAKKLNPTDRQPFPVTYKQYYDDFCQARNEACDYYQLSNTIKSEWTIHTFRHTKLTSLAGRGANAAQIMAWAGHKSLSISQRYVHGSAFNLNELVLQETGSTSNLIEQV